MATDHFNVSNFVVNIDGLQASQFTEVSGLEVVLEALSYQEGAMNLQQSRKGRARYQNIILKRRFNGDKELSEWMKACVEGEPVKRSGSIILNDDNGSEVLRFNFTNGWPVAWRPPVLSTQQRNQVSCEELELDIETLEIA